MNKYNIGNGSINHKQADLNKACYVILGSTEFFFFFS